MYSTLSEVANENAKTFYSRALKSNNVGLTQEDKFMAYAEMLYHSNGKKVFWPVLPKCSTNWVPRKPLGAAIINIIPVPVPQLGIYWSGVLGAEIDVSRFEKASGKKFEHVTGLDSEKIVCCVLSFTTKERKVCDSKFQMNISRKRETLSEDYFLTEELSISYETDPPKEIRETAYGLVCRVIYGVKEDENYHTYQSALN